MSDILTIRITGDNNFVSAEFENATLRDALEAAEERIRFADEAIDAGTSLLAKAGELLKADNALLRDRLNLSRFF